MKQLIDKIKSYHPNITDSFDKNLPILLPPWFPPAPPITPPFDPPILITLPPLPTVNK